MSEQQWRDSPLGDPCGWPFALRLAAELVLESPAPMWLAWGNALAVRARAGEVVLVVDDEAAALRLLDAHPDIALLFTDVLMPELDGRELAARALQRRPGLPVLFTSGHTRNVEAVEGMPERARILPKPFTLAQLASQVRMALDGE